MEKDLKKLLVPETVSLKEILNQDFKYIIPIYQRPYSWEKSHIFKLISSLSNSQKGYIFLGNMEIKETNIDNQFDIIDGQQRITTILILLNYLFSSIGNSMYNDDILKKMLYIKINENEENSESKKFLEFLNNKNTQDIQNAFNKCKKQSETRALEEDLRIKNIYRLNYYYIKQALIAEEIGKENYEELIENILEKTYIIRVNIKNNKDKYASMTEDEAIQIFDVINTTGKPLDTSDIFKIRIYEYAKRFNKQEAMFERINKLYNDIKSTNLQIINTEEDEKAKYRESRIISEKFGINNILNVYKYILIAKRKSEEYKDKLYKMGIDRFYDYLFSCLLSNTDIKEFNSFKENGVNIEEIEQIYKSYLNISMMFAAPKEYNISSDTFFAYELLKGYTRYSWIYSFLPVIYYWKFNSLNDELSKFIILISKMLSFYSIADHQVRNPVKSYINENIILKIVKANFNDKLVAQDINNGIKQILDNEFKSWRGNEFIQRISGEVANISYAREICCFINAKNAEDRNIEKNNESNKDNISNENINNLKLDRYKILFTKKFDIEHINALKDKTLQENKEENEEEQKNKNHLGNLMLLEYNINRSIGNDLIKNKIKKYENSDISIVKEEISDLRNLNDEDYKNYFENRNKRNIQEIKQFFAL